VEGVRLSADRNVVSAAAGVCRAREVAVDGGGFTAARVAERTELYRVRIPVAGRHQKALSGRQGWPQAQTFL